MTSFYTPDFNIMLKIKTIHPDYVWIDTSFVLYVLLKAFHLDYVSIVIMGFWKYDRVICPYYY